MRAITSTLMMLGLFSIAVLSANPYEVDPALGLDPQEIDAVDDPREIRSEFLEIGDEELQAAAAATSGDKTFFNSFLSGLSMIMVSELGDKTFFIAALMAMKYSRMVVYFGALGALALMTVLSAALGWVAPQLIPKTFTTIFAGILFLVFGIKLLYEAYRMEDEDIDDNDELKEVEAELNQVQEKLLSVDGQHTTSNEKFKGDVVLSKKALRLLFLQAFSMTFIAEWGDRSQIATIVLAASQNPYAVSIGAILGHAICTGLAVLGGKLLASKISEKTVSYCGGTLFLIFGIFAFV